MKELNYLRIAKQMKKNAILSDEINVFLNENLS